MRPPSAAARAALLLLLPLAAGCARCGRAPAAAPAERWVPADAAGALLVPELGGLVRQVAALQSTLAAMPGGEDLTALRASLAAQLGFDLLDAAALGDAGLDAARGLALASLAPRGDEPRELPLLVLPVKDAGRLDALLARLARERLGAGERAKENANGRAFDVWRRAAGEPAALAVAVVDGTALVSAGPNGPAVLRQVLALDPALSLEKSPSWQRARGVLGELPGAALWIPPGSPALEEAILKEGLAVGVRLGARELAFTAVALLGVQEAKLRPLAGVGPGSTRPPAEDPASVAMARLSASPAAVVELVAEAAGREVPPPLAPIAQALEPGVDVGLVLPPQAELGALLASRGRGDPLRAFRVEVVATVKDGAALGPTFDELARKAGGSAAPGRWSIPTGEGEVAWSLRGRTLAVSAGPKGGLDALLARVGGQRAAFTAPTKASAEALSGGLGGLVLHGDNLARALQALPPEAWGTGPDAVVTRSLAEKIAAPGGHASAISLRADLPAGAVRLAFTVELGEPPPRTP